jgi:hypothetical protein
LVATKSNVTWDCNCGRIVYEMTLWELQRFRADMRKIFPPVIRVDTAGVCSGCGFTHAQFSEPSGKVATLAVKRDRDRLPPRVKGKSD